MNYLSSNVSMDNSDANRQNNHSVDKPVQFFNKHTTDSLQFTSKAVSKTETKYPLNTNNKNIHPNPLQVRCQLTFYVPFVISFSLICFSVFSLIFCFIL